MLVGDKMRERTGSGRHRHEQEKPDRAKTARQRAANGNSHSTLNRDG